MSVDGGRRRRERRQGHRRRHRRHQPLRGRGPLLDEPTAALGVRESNQVLKLIQGLRERGLPALPHRLPTAYLARSDSATVRRAWAAIVSAGFIAADDGKWPPSITQRLSRSCALHHGSSTLVAGSAPATTVPHW